MDLNFEKSLNQLENIINKLENDDVSLDEAIVLFEQGVKLSGDCRKTLETAEQKIISLTEAESEKND